MSNNDSEPCISIPIFVAIVILIIFGLFSLSASNVNIGLPVHNSSGEVDYGYIINRFRLENQDDEDSKEAARAANAANRSTKQNQK